MDLRERRLSILHRVESGELSPDDGNRLLTELEERVIDEISEPAVAANALWAAGLNPSQGNLAAQASPIVIPKPELALIGKEELVPGNNPVHGSFSAQPQPEVIERNQAVETLQGEQRMPGWHGLWVLPFLLGLFLTLISINWMYLGLASAGLGWGFWLSFFPLALGILLMWAGWELRKARWLHLRISQRSGQNPKVIAISLPLPIGLTRWAIQRFGKFSPQVHGQDVGDFLDEFDQAIATDGPMHVYVDDAGGDRVGIWIEGPLKK